MVKNNSYARTIDIRRVKKFIDTDESGIVNNYTLREALGLHKYKVDDCLSFLLDFGLIDMVVKNRNKYYFSKTRQNPNGKKSILAGKRDSKQYEEDVKILNKVEEKSILFGDLNE